MRRQKKRLFRFVLTILTFFLIISIAANVFLLRRVFIERERVRNSVVPISSVDYYRYLLSYVKQDSAENSDAEDPDSPRNNPLIYPEDRYNHEVQFVSQLPEYPNGCEAASAVMLLRYCDYDISLDEFIEKYLMTDEVYNNDGTRYGPDPSRSYAGDPSDEDSGWGCFAPVIYDGVMRAMMENEGRGYGPIDLSTIPLYNITEIGLPTAIWVTTDYTPVREVFQWQSYNREQTYSYPRNQHVVVLVDEDEEHYYILDPLKTEERIAVEKNVLEACFDSMGRQAVTIQSPKTYIPEIRKGK